MKTVLMIACASMLCLPAAATEYNAVESRQTYGTAKIIQLYPVRPKMESDVEVQVWTDEATGCRYAVLGAKGDRLQLLPSLSCENSRTVKIR